MSLEILTFSTQQLLYDALTTKGLKVSDFLSMKGDPPWVAINDISQNPAFSKERLPIGWQVQVSAQVVSNYRGKKEASEISQIILDTMYELQEEQDWGEITFSTNMVSVFEENKKEFFISHTLDFQFIK
ncbi:MAG: hypothetical protein ACFB15_25740 [Cyclobacteriaceae bacterium]